MPPPFFSSNKGFEDTGERSFPPVMGQNTQLRGRGDTAKNGVTGTADTRFMIVSIVSIPKSPVSTYQEELQPSSSTKD